MAEDSNEVNMSLFMEDVQKYNCLICMTNLKRITETNL